MGEIKRQIPISQEELDRRAERDAVRAERDAVAAEQARIQEEAVQEWARQQARGTVEALEARRTCESFGLVLARAWANPGANTTEPQCVCQNREEAFDGLLVHNMTEDGLLALARGEDHDSDWTLEDDDVEAEFRYDDAVGYLEDFTGAKAQRRAANGARRRVRTEKTWVSGEKLRARAPAHPRQQKQALVVCARQDVAEARRLRMLRQTSRVAQSCA